MPKLSFLETRLRLLLVVQLLFWSAPVLAQGQNGSQLGDWELYNESRNGAVRSNTYNTAGTVSSDQEARLELTCFTYQVGLILYPGGTFTSALDPSRNEDHIVFTRVGKVDYFRRTLLKHWADTSSFDSDVEELIRGSTLMICPKEDDKDPACLTFSLKGFTAALKALCPKR